MTLTRTSGVVLAATAAAMIVSGLAVYAPAASAAGASVRCFGVNSCKGPNNSCKGHGIVDLPRAACLAKGGKIVG